MIPAEVFSLFNPLSDFIVAMWRFLKTQDGEYIHNRFGKKKNYPFSC